MFTWGTNLFFSDSSNKWSSFLAPFTAHKPFTIPTFKTCLLTFLIHLRLWEKDLGLTLEAESLIVNLYPLWPSLILFSLPTFPLMSLILLLPYILLSSAYTLILTPSIYLLLHEKKSTIYWNTHAPGIYRILYKIFLNIKCKSKRFDLCNSTFIQYVDDLSFCLKTYSNSFHEIYLL